MRLKVHRCKRCHHEWAGRSVTRVPDVEDTVLRVPSHILCDSKKELPKYCPHCKSPYWNRERKKVAYA